MKNPLLFRMVANHICCVFVHVRSVLFLFCLYIMAAYAYDFKSEVHCGSALGPGASGLPVTAHHFYAFLLYLEC